MKNLSIVLSLAALALVCFFTIRWAAPRIERDVESRARSVLSNAGLGWADPVASGRDLRLGGVAPSEAALRYAEELARGVRGVRRVSTRASLARLAPVGARPPTPSRVESSSATTGCEAELGSLLSLTSIGFLQGRYTLRAPQREQLSELAAALRRCPEARVEIAAHADARGSSEMNRRLSRDRARSVAEFLVLAGVSERRLSIGVYGESRPLADNTSEDGRAKNRRIEFKLQGS